MRPDGAVYQWRKVPPSELSVALVADERFGGATRRVAQPEVGSFCFHPLHPPELSFAYWRKLLTELSNLAC